MQREVNKGSRREVNLGGEAKRGRGRGQDKER